VLGISPRLVAKILSRNRNPIAIPCHRIVKSDNGLGGYTLNGKKVPEFKKRLIDLESLHNLCRYSLSELLEIK
jgi:methylated-DNA-[protein]-cysteine S-methyltransferase